VRRRQAEVFVDAKQAGHGVGSAGVDDGESVTLANQIASGEAVAVEAGLDAKDAIGNGLVRGSG
jgi:hypothetical protein